MATCTTQAQSTVNVNATPQIIDSNQSNVLCNGNSNGTASVIVSSGTPTYNFVWSTLPVQTTAGASGLGAGMYTVTVVDANNCTAKQTFTITQPQPLTLAINTPTTCKNTPTVITANVSGGTANYNYTWQLGNYTGNTILVNATNTNYTLNVIDANNCVITGTTAVSVATIMANFNYLINPCDKYLVTTNTSSNAINYNWSLGDNSSSININPTHTYVSGGNYTLSLIATNSFGCKDTLKKVIQINSADCDSTIFGIAKAASISIVHNDLYTITFKVIAVNSATSNLSNVSLFDDLTTVFAAPSTFTVISAPQLLSNNSALAVNPLFNGVNSTNLLMPTTSTLMANKKDTLAFTIQFSSNKNCGPFKNIITGNATTKLNFLVSDASQNGSNVDSDGDGNPKNNNEPTPITLPFCDLFVPDAFSPNGDGKNEVFVINGLNCRSIKLTVFNRWGSKVYEHNNYDNSWNGSASVKNTFSGNALLPQGTYYYILEYTDGDKEVKTGFVVLQY